MAGIRSLNTFTILITSSRNTCSACDTSLPLAALPAKPGRSSPRADLHLGAVLPRTAQGPPVMVKRPASTSAGQQFLLIQRWHILHHRVYHKQVKRFGIHPTETEIERHRLKLTAVASSAHFPWRVTMGYPNLLFQCNQ